MPAPPVFRPQLAAIAQRTTAQRTAAQSTTPARNTVVQRVTYRTVLYTPGNVGEQEAFQKKAKEDMEAKGTWAPGRSEAYITDIGESTATIADVDALSEAEQGKWHDYDRGTNQDLAGAGLGTITTQLGVIKTQLAQAETTNVKVAVEAAILLIEQTIGQIPGKWNIGKHTGFGAIKVAVTNYLRLEPWTKAATEEEVERLRLELIEDRRLLAGKKDPKPVKSKDATRKKAADKVQNITEKGVEVRQLVDQPGTVAAKISLVIRQSAKQQYDRGKSAHTSTKSTMKQKKQYLGEIATTGKLREKGDKGRGILWASPWSPGVNTAFLEGGAEGENVFKLKTPIPDDLKGFLSDGRITEFKAAVKDKTTAKYYPFWNSLEDPARFTIYTNELEYLIGKGYRLHEFPTTKGGTQQIMVAPGKLDAVRLAYAGR
jgi:hypothetical protein